MGDRPEALAEQRCRYAASNREFQRRENAEGTLEEGIRQDARSVDDKEIRLPDCVKERDDIAGAAAAECALRSQHGADEPRPPQHEPLLEALARFGRDARQPPSDRPQQAGLQQQLTTAHRDCLDVTTVTSDTLRRVGDDRIDADGHSSRNRDTATLSMAMSPTFWQL